VESLLASTQRALIAALQNDHAQAVLEAEIGVASRTLQRLKTPLKGPTNDVAVGDAALQDIKNNINQLRDRMADVERLLLYHDNWIQKQAKAGVMPPPGPQP
jgi:hypothetical protein